jgi:RND family efflux transporter MFP subunit
MITRRDIVISSLTLTTLLFFAGCSRKTTSSLAPSVVSELSTTQVRTEQLPKTVSATGTVHATESASLSVQVTGRVMTVSVKEGDAVHRGQMLLSLDSAQMQSEGEGAQASVAGAEQDAQMAQTEASLAATTLQRYQLLRERKSVSPQEFDEVERRAQAAKAHLDSLRARVTAAKAAAASAHTVLGYTRLQAPFNGVITARHVDPGTLASPGLPLLEVEKSGKLRLSVTVDESILHNLQQGMPIEVEIAALASPLAGARVAEIVPAADPASHTFSIKIDLPAAKGLHTGMFGTAMVKTGSRSALLIPQAALVTHGSLNGIWVLDANRIASLRYVTTGEKHGTDIEILSGMSSGETIVLAPGDRELSGKQIEVRP